MNIFVKLGHDIVRLWNEYSGLYLNGVWNTISLAVLCTAVCADDTFRCGAPLACAGIVGEASGRKGN